MTFTDILVLTLGTVALAPPVAAQHRTLVEGVAGGVVTSASPAFAGALAGVVIRPVGSGLGGRLMAGPGRQDGGLAGRFEGVVTYRLPGPRGRSRVYVGGGVSVERGRRDGEFVLVVVGVEGQPRSAVGLLAEAGIGGGLRILLGVRVRRRG